MSKLKKILMMTTAYVLVVAIAIGGTVAYLTSEDSDVNVMTLGNVKIEQIEQERDENGGLQDFTQAKPALPAVGPVKWDDEGVDVNGAEYKVFSDDLKNVVDKIVTVKNTGKSDAYIRTLVAIEAPDYDPNNLIHINWNSTGVKISDLVKAEIDGVEYVVFAFTYDSELAAGKVSAPSLMQVFLDSKTTNEDCALFGNSWEIMVLSQAVQTAGFEDAATALNTGFGEVNEENAKLWFGNVGIIRTASKAYESTLTSGEYVLGADINTSDSNKHYNGNREYAITGGRDYTINLNGHTINHDGTYQDGKNTGYTYLFTVAHANSKLTINGEGTLKSANSEGLVSIIYAQSGTETVINGGDFRPDKGVAVWAGNGAKITINGGSFISTGSGEELIYSSGGVIDIYGGFFHNTEWENRPVNVANANRGNGRINIYGGTFVNCDPSTGCDDPGQIKVAEGYKVVSEPQANGDIWYTVVAE